MKALLRTNECRANLVEAMGDAKVKAIHSIHMKDFEKPLLLQILHMALSF